MKKTKTSELNPARNEHHRKWTQFNRETILIILVSICAIITAGSHFRMNDVVDGAADIKAGYEVNIRNMIESNTALTKQVLMLQNKVNRYEAELYVREEK